MGSTQSIDMVNNVLNQESVIGYDCFDGYLETEDNILGVQKYIVLKAGCKGKIEASEDFDGGIVIMISVERDDHPSPRELRLTYDSQSLGDVPANKIFIPMIVNGVPFIPSLAQLNRVYSRQTSIPINVGPIDLNGNVRNAFTNAILGNNGNNIVNAVRNGMNSNANYTLNGLAVNNNGGMTVGSRRRVGNSCSCKK